MGDSRTDEPTFSICRTHRRDCPAGHAASSPARRCYARHPNCCTRSACRHDDRRDRRRSGVSKATIYKWWPNKYAVAVEAFLSEMMAESSDPDPGAAREDLRSVLRGLVHFYSGPSGQVYAQLVGEGQSDQLVQRELRDHLVAPRREVLRAIWDRGVARGELRADVDPGAAFDLVFAPLLYRLLLGHAPLDEAAADAIVDVALRGLALGD